MPAKISSSKNQRKIARIGKDAPLDERRTSLPGRRAETRSPLVRRPIRRHRPPSRSAGVSLPPLPSRTGSCGRRGFHFETVIRGIYINISKYMYTYFYVYTFRQLTFLGRRASPPRIPGTSPRSRNLRCTRAGNDGCTARRRA